MPKLETTNLKGAFTLMPKEPIGPFTLTLRFKNGDKLFLCDTIDDIVENMLHYCENEFVNG